MPKSTKDKQVFDVAKPGNAQPDATSRPVIVGHKPEIEDPMMTKLQSEQTAAKSNTTTEMDDKKPESQADNKTLLSSGDRITITPPSQAEPKIDEVTKPKSEQEENEAEVDKAPADQSTTEQSASVTEQTAEKSSDDVEADSQATPAETSQKKQEEENAKLEALEKTIESKKYYAPIREVHHKSSLGRFFVTILILLLLGIVGTDLAMDAGFIKTDLQPPIDLIKN